MSPRKYSKVKWNDFPDNLFPRPTDPIKAWDIICHHVLGHDWYTTGSIHAWQVNTEQLVEILTKVPSERYRRLPWYIKIYLNIKVFLENLRGKDSHISDYY